MTLLAMNGCETLEAKTGFSHTGLATTATGRTSIALRVTGASGAFDYSVPGSITRAIYGFGVRVQTTANNSFQLFRIFTSNSQEFTINQLSASDTTVVLRSGSTAGTILANSGVQLSINVWHYMEVDVLIGAAGHVKVWLDDVQIINYSGAVGTGNLATLSHRTGTASATIDIDDIYVLNLTDATATQGRPNNDRIGPVRVESIYPNGNGATNQFVGSDGNSTDNYLLVDETGAPNTADYVDSSTVGNRDLYEHTSLTSAGITDIIAVEVVAYAQDIGGGATPLKTVARDNSGGTISTGAGNPTSATFREVGGGILGVNPDGTAWTEAIVNGSQFGVEVG